MDGGLATVPSDWVVYQFDNGSLRELVQVQLEDFGLAVVRISIEQKAQLFDVSAGVRCASSHD